MVKSLVVTGFGINCEEEMAAAYRLAGAEADVVHLNQIFKEKVSIHEYDILNFPGGFSFGDDLGSARVLANKFKFKRMASGRRFIDEIERFLGDGRYIMGVCNGFQALVKMGLLPNVSGTFEQEATLTHNDSGKFEDRWVTCKVTAGTPSPFLKDIDLIDLPVRHGEGKLIIGSDALREEIINKKLNGLSYADENGRPTAEYPLNPNGSELNCAALSDLSGQVFGLMPHPEAYLSAYNHPDWGIRKIGGRLDEQGQGLKIFVNIVNHMEKEKNN